ncbi:MAG: butyrate kinase [Bacillota bacterium]|jgi:butyrate kinase
MHRLLAINPGSTSTKLGIFEDHTMVQEQVLRHSNQDLAGYERLIDQFPFRKQAVLAALAEAGIQAEDLDAVVGRGGLLKPIPGGTYTINEAMLRDLRGAVYGEHASNLGALLAAEVARPVGIPAFIVDPVVVDELQPLARLTGLPQINQRSIFHALNQKAVARRVAADLGREYEALHLIVVHLGGGISVGAHRQGRVVDVNNALDGDGPFSPERSGGLPAADLVRLCFSGQYDEPAMRKLLVGQGGMVAYLGTNDGREVVRRIKAGDQQAELVYQALAYQVSKEIGRAAAVLRGQVDAIVITGGLAYDEEHLVRWIKERVSFIAQILVHPGEDELSALADGALRVLNGLESAKVYA